MPTMEVAIKVDHLGQRGDEPSHSIREKGLFQGFCIPEVSSTHSSILALLRETNSQYPPDVCRRKYRRNGETCYEPLDERDESNYVALSDHYGLEKPTLVVQCFHNTVIVRYEGQVAWKIERAMGLNYTYKIVADSFDFARYCLEIAGIHHRAIQTAYNNRNRKGKNNDNRSTKPGSQQQNQQQQPGNVGVGVQD